MDVEYNQYWLPTTYFDGGQFAMGLNGQGAYSSAINVCGQREVTELDLRVETTYLGGGELHIYVSLRHYDPNSAPNQPSAPTGDPDVHTNMSSSYSISTTDPNGDPVYYMWDFDGDVTSWKGPYVSGSVQAYDYTWPTEGTKSVRVKAKDFHDAETAWSDPLAVDVWICGDANGSGEVDIDDVVYVIAYIFGGGPEPEPLASGDANCGSGTDIDDVVYIIAFIFGGGNPPCEVSGGPDPDC